MPAIDDSRSLRPPRLSRTQAAILFIAAAVCVLILTAFAWTAYPPPGIDATGLVPAAISKAAGYGFVNPVFQYAWQFDPEARFVYHGPLYPLLLAATMREPTAIAAMRMIGCVNVLTIILMTLFFCRILWQPNTRASWAPVLTTALCLGLTTSYLSTYNGRPETFAVLVVTAGACVIPLVWKLRCEFVFWGIGLGLLAASHPVAFMEILTVFGIYLAGRYSIPGILWRMGGVLLVAATIFTFVFAFMYPYPFGDWVNGMRESSRVSTGGWAPELIIPRWIFHPDLPCLGIVCLMSAIAFVCVARRNLGQIASQRLFVLGCVVLGVLIFHFAIRVSHRLYNILPLMPLLLGGLIWVARRPVPTNVNPRSARQYARFLLLVLVVSNLGIARELALFPVYLAGGTTLAVERREFSLWSRQHPDGKIGLTNAEWALGENYSRMRVFPSDEYTVGGHPQVRYIVHQQYYYHETQPPEFPPFVLQEDHYSHVPVAVFGIPITRTWPGYQFAIYELPPALLQPQIGAQGKAAKIAANSNH
jgi:hypothetical protein